MSETAPRSDQPPALAPVAAPAEPPGPLADFDEWLAGLLGDLVEPAHPDA